MTLRDRLRDFEFRLADLVRNAAFNESTTTKLNQWCARMLSETSTLRLPGEVALGLAEHFNLQEVAMRVWGLELPAEGVGAPVEESIHTYANELSHPYVGVDTTLAPVSWLNARASFFSYSAFARLSA